MNLLNKSLLIILLFTGWLNGQTKAYLIADSNFVYLDTDPQDAYVYKADSLLGHTPFFIDKNLNNVIIEKPGYKQKTIDLKDLKIKDKINLIFTGELQKQKFYESTAFKVLTGSLIVLGTISAYYKIKADKYFDDYQFAGTKTDLDKTRRYDLISGITLGAVQINFGVLIYYFLTD